MILEKQIHYKLLELGGDILLIHSDIMQGFEIPFINKGSFLISQIDEIKSLRANINIWMPTFNYDFCKGKDYYVKTCPSQVGVLTEHFRKNVAQWRTPIPVFSFAGIGENPNIEISGIIDPFGPHSAFHILYEEDSLLMHYGSSLNSSTILHYAERISNFLYYRYDKHFYGKVINNDDREINVDFKFHVRPMGMNLDYDWVKIEKDLIENNILHTFKEGRSRILLCKVKSLIDYWIYMMKLNPLYLLDNESKKWVEPLLDKLGRPFVLSDFEPVK